MPDLDERLLVAMRAARQNHLSAWVDALREHRGHESFMWADDPRTRKVGFICFCSGAEEHWELSLTELSQSLPAHREWILAQRFHLCGRGAKKRRKAEHRARIKARALLHRYLTREQRWDLRASRSFRIQGQDGQTYLITENAFNNVKLLEDGVPVTSFCVIARHDVVKLPVYDLMLAQKVMLESEIESFQKIAITQNLKIPRAPLVPRAPLLDIPNQDLDNPAAWVADQVRRIEGESDGNPDRLAD